MKTELNLRVCGRENNAVTLTDLQKIATPERTESYQPIGHADLVAVFREQLKAAKLSVVQELHTVARFGQRYFGLFQIDMGKAGTAGTVIGLRNSHDKSFPAGIMAGNAPFVCDNLIFHNEVVLGRRHTTNLMRDLPQVVSRAIGKLGDTWTKHENRVAAYTAKGLGDDEADSLILRGYRAGAIGKTQIADVLTQWEKPNHEDFAPRNLWSLHNAFTEVYKGNLVALPKRSEALHSVFDPFAGLNLTVNLAPEEVEVVA